MPLLRLILFCVLACLSGVSLCAAAEGKVRLFILSGQSNMEGMNPALSFTPAVKKAFPNDDVIVVYYAKGGTPIRCWWKGWHAPFDATSIGGNQPPGALYETLMANVKTALGGKTPDSVAFVWMQGERDAKSGLSGSYEEALKALLQSVRDDLKHPAVAVVIGRLSDHLKGNAQWDAVRAIQEKVATQDPHGAWVDTDDLNGSKNDLHCTKEGFVELGHRFAAKSVELLSQPPPSAAKP